MPVDEGVDDSFFGSFFNSLAADDPSELVEPPPAASDPEADAVSPEPSVVEPAVAALDEPLRLSVL